MPFIFQNPIIFFAPNKTLIYTKHYAQDKNYKTWTFIRICLIWCGIQVHFQVHFSLHGGGIVFLQDGSSKCEKYKHFLWVLQPPVLLSKAWKISQQTNGIKKQFLKIKLNLWYSTQKGGNKTSDLLWVFKSAHHWLTVSLCGSTSNTTPKRWLKTTSEECKRRWNKYVLVNSNRCKEHQSLHFCSFFCFIYSVEGCWWILSMFIRVLLSVEMAYHNDTAKIVLLY